MATFKKDPKMKYTDMCIYIDANISKVTETGKYPDIEAKIIEYLYHILYALACKKSFFRNFADYDDFALYGASELYISMRNRFLNIGKVVRGKEVVPIKSCLNFIKSVLFPLKVNYQKQNYATVLNPEIDERIEGYADKLKENVRDQYRKDLQTDLEEILENLPENIYKILKQTPYRNDPVMIKKLYLSCVLTFINDITIPNKLKNKLDKKNKNSEVDDMVVIYKNNPSDVILWHLDEGLANYVRILVVKIKRIFTDEITEYRFRSDLSDEIVDDILKTVYSTYDTDREDY